MTDARLSELSPVPAPPSLPGWYRRHDPGKTDLLRAMDQLVDHVDWPALTWSELVEGLLRVGATDIPLGRLVEGHVDALRILQQAGTDPRPGARYGVWASRSAGTGVSAVADGDRLRLNGVMRFASGAGLLDRALVPVWLDAATHLLVDLEVADLPVDRSHWRTAAMQVSQTHSVVVADVGVSSHDVIGPPGFYLERAGFLPGGVGVAAVWTGGLVRVLDVTASALGQRVVSTTQAVRLGRARQRLVTALAVVRTAGRRLDQLMEGLRAGEQASPAVAGVCAECRAVVADAAVNAIADIRALAGPAALAFDIDLGRALDDLGLYAAQLNADAEAEHLGASLLPQL